MGGFFASALKEDCVFDLFFGTDYHSHLGTRRAGMAVYGKDGFNRAIHNIESSPFRTKFESDLQKMEGYMGIGCISDYEPQPLIVRSHHGTYAITTVGRINNIDELSKKILDKNGTHFLEMSGGDINATELVAALINQKDNLVEGIKYAQDMIDGSMTMLLLTRKGIYCSRDKLGRTPLVIGRKEEGFCASFESFAYLNIGYKEYKELGPGEICVMTPDGVTTLSKPGTKPPVMRESLSRACVSAAGTGWRDVIRLPGRISTRSQAFRIPVLLTRSDMPTSRVCLSRDLLSSIPRHGRDLLCLPCRQSAI